VKEAREEESPKSQVGTKVAVTEEAEVEIRRTKGDIDDNCGKLSSL
jgi:hypothetical protein